MRGKSGQCLMVCALAAALTLTGQALADKVAPPAPNSTAAVRPVQESVDEAAQRSLTSASQADVIKKEVDAPRGGGDGREGGETCADAFVIPALPYSDTGDTCDNIDDYDEECPYGGSTSPDVVYVYEPVADELVTISLCNDPTDYDTKLYVYENTCPDPGNPYACNDDACSTVNYPSPYVSEIADLQLLAGNQYYIVVDGYGGSCGVYELSVAVVAGCDVECPPGATPEGEPVCEDEYVDSFNGGCNSDPSVFSPITCGETVCGTSGTFLVDGINNRDTDWYRLDLTEPTTITWTAVAEFPVQIFVIDAGTEDCVDYTILDGASAAPCDPATLTLECVPAGVYWLWVAPSVFEGVDCGAEYVATLDCVPCGGCTPDYTVTAPGTWTGNTCGAGND